MKTTYSMQQFLSVLLGLGYLAESDTQTPVRDRPAAPFAPSQIQVAIRAFQTHYTLPVTGEADQPTQEKARQLVRNLHHGLKHTVNPDLCISEFYGPKTVSAVEQFQKQRSLPVTGIASASVRQAIEEDLKQQLRQQAYSIPQSDSWQSACSCAK